MLQRGVVFIVKMAKTRENAKRFIGQEKPAGFSLETASAHIESSELEKAPNSVYCDLDPFNHGTTTIAYEPVDSKTFGKLARVLKAGWDLDAPESIEQVCEAEKNSNNYRVHTRRGRTHLLKASHITAPIVQELVNECLIDLRKYSARAPQLIRTSRHGTYYPSNGLYCLHAFIDGEHFDGSRKELINTAQQLGSLHAVLEQYLPADEVRARKGSRIAHNPHVLEEVVKRLERVGERTPFDRYVLGCLKYIKDRSEKVSAANIFDLPKQVIHYDGHPHNLLFDKGTKELLAFIDFDSILYSQRARDVGFAMHRLARTCGEQTERKQDVGVDVRDRGKQFLEQYHRINPLTDEEIKMLPLVIQDEALFRVLSVLNDHYIKGITTWSFDLPKQITTLEEGAWFEF